LLDQLLRAGTSVGANIVEAKSSGTKKEFIRYYQIALKSSNETRYWLYLIRDGLSLENENLKSLIKENEEISKIIAKSILTLKTPKPENK
jgi:four helix bundle protein